MGFQLLPLEMMAIAGVVGIAFGLIAAYLERRKGK